jgi:hypothetical protein
LAGYTGWGNGFEPGHNYIANNLYTRRSAGLETGLAALTGSYGAVQIHELGVAMEGWTNVHVDAQGKYQDKDSGMALEECVSKKLKK